MATTLIVPGLYNSGPHHWQTWLEAKTPAAKRVLQENWSVPNFNRWTSAVRRAISQSSGDIYIAAHSFGCLAAVLAAAEQPHRIGGMLIVAPADPQKFGLSNVLPRHHPGFPTVVVASRNDPWMPFASACQWASRWRSTFIDAGAAGHMNTEAGFGHWPRGLALLRQLQTSEIANIRAPCIRRTAQTSPAFLSA